MPVIDKYSVTNLTSKIVFAVYLFKKFCIYFFANWAIHDQSNFLKESMHSKIGKKRRKTH